MIGSGLDWEARFCWRNEYSICMADPVVGR